MKISFRKKRNFKKVVITIFFVTAALFLINLYEKEVRNFFYSISLPFQKSLWRIGDNISDFFSGITQANKLKKENESLRLENQKILSENVILKELKKENELLRTALGLGLEKDFRLVFGQIIGKDISQDALIIDKGFKDGIKKNFPVISEEKALAGKISEVYEDFSKVMLISAKGNSFDGEISEKEIFGMVKGKGSFKVVFELLPKEKEIKEGDLVITSALGGIFPKGLLIGRIKRVEKSDVEPFQRAEISPLFDIRETENLFIIVM